MSLAYGRTGLPAPPRYEFDVGIGLDTLEPLLEVKYHLQELRVHFFAMRRCYLTQWVTDLLYAWDLECNYASQEIRLHNSDMEEWIKSHLGFVCVELGRWHWASFESRASTHQAASYRFLQMACEVRLAADRLAAAGKTHLALFCVFPGYCLLRFFVDDDFLFPPSISFFIYSGLGQYPYSAPFRRAFSSGGTHTCVRPWESSFMHAPPYSSRLEGYAARAPPAAAQVDPWDDDAEHEDPEEEWRDHMARARSPEYGSPRSFVSRRRHPLEQTAGGPSTVPEIGRAHV